MLEITKLNDFLAKYKLVFYIVVIGVVVWFINDWRDLRKENAAKESFYTTLAQKFEVIEGVAKAQNVLLENSKKQGDILVAFGQGFADTMKAQNNVLIGLSQSMGRVEGKVTTGGVGPTTVVGTVAGADLTQNRETNPSLTTAKVSVDMKNPNAPKWDVRWFNNPETFKVNFGLFKKGSSEGEVTAYTTLTREVSRADGAFVGKEEVKIGESTMKFDPEFLKNIAGGGGKLDIPRMGIFAGAGWDATKNRWTPGVGIDYRFTDRMTVMGGYINNGPWVGGKYTFNLR